MNRQKLITALQQNNLSITKSRLILFSIIEESHEGLTISEIIDKASGKIDRSTVYRIIDQFEKAAIVRKNYHGWKFKIELSDTYQQHHHHFTCTKCGTILSIEEPLFLDTWLEELAVKESISISSHSLEFSGLCSNCK